MAWSLVAVGTLAHATGGNLTLTEPTGAASGDLLVCSIGFADSTAPLSVPSGWSTAVLENNGDTGIGDAGKRSVLISYVVRGASAPDLTWTRTGGDVARGGIVAFRSDAGGTITLGTNKSQHTNAAAGTSITLPGITTEAANALLCFGTATGVNSGSAWGDWAAATDPTAASWSEHFDSSTSSGADIRVGFATAVKGTSGATGDFSATSAISGYLSGAVVAFYEDSLGGGSSVTGSLAATESGSDTASFTGSVEALGSLSASETGSDTASFAGSVEASGALAASETGSDTAAFSGSFAPAGVSGTLAATESGSDTAAFAGSVDPHGALAAQETGSDTASFTGTTEGGVVPDVRREVVWPGWRKPRPEKKRDKPDRAAALKAAYAAVHALRQHLTAATVKALLAIVGRDHPGATTLPSPDEIDWLWLSLIEGLPDQADAVFALALEEGQARRRAAAKPRAPVPQQTVPDRQRSDRIARIADTAGRARREAQRRDDEDVLLLLLTA